MGGRSTRSLGIVTREEAIASFAVLDRDRQLRFLARYGHLLTVAARDTYVPGTNDVSDPPRLRHANELMHRVFAQIAYLLSASDARFPDEALVELLWNDWPLFTEGSRWAFEEALRSNDNA